MIDRHRHRKHGLKEKILEASAVFTFGLCLGILDRGHFHWSFLENRPGKGGFCFSGKLEPQKQKLVGRLRGGLVATGSQPVR